MRNHDAADDIRASYHDDPVNHIEPEPEREETPEQQTARMEREAYREAGKKFIALMVGILNFMHEAGNAAELSARLWVVSSAFDHPCCDGFHSNTQIADKLGVSRADYSKLLLQFQRQKSLPPSGFQKRATARESYRKTRKQQLNGNTATGNPNSKNQ